MMKKFSLLPLAAALALVVSCEKPQSEADRNAQVERDVQQRLDAERQADQQNRLAQQQADLDAREKALANKESVPTATATPRVVQRAERTESRTRVASSDREAPRSYDTFYRKLEPYGAWRETDTYGYVWQPRQAQQARDWRPYTNGRWAYTDAGWTWVSQEPFGWATYHYGRWTRLQNVGWVWVPGEEWAPAWVSWRKGDRNVGWAPLPPDARFDRNTGIKKWADSYYDISADEYVFIPNEDIGSDRLERDVIPVERNVTIVNETTNVTNITYNNTTVVNEGPNFDELRGHSRRPIERMQLRREYDVEQDATPQANVSGAILSMVTPIFSARAVERPRNLGEPIRQARVERNWTNNANQPEAERARARMKSEATPPPNAPPRRFEKPAVAPGTPTASPVATAEPVAPTPAATPTATASAAPIAATPVPTAIPTVTATATIPPRPHFTPRPTIIPATPEPAPSVIATPAKAATVIPLGPARKAPGLETPAPTPPEVIPEVTATPVRNFPRRPQMTPRAVPSATPVTETAAPTPPVAATETPIRKFPQRPQMTPRVFPSATPVTETAAPNPAEAIAATPVRKFPQRPQMNPRTLPTAAPATDAASPTPVEAQEPAKNEKRDRKEKRRAEKFEASPTPSKDPEP
ncbi:MAG: DUF6600 domain-containing protein [Chthoniobacterales bacterium]